MSLFQILMAAVAAFFAYQLYLHVRNLQEPVKPSGAGKRPSPIDPEALVERADAAFGARNYERAINLLREAEGKAPKDAEIKAKLGYILTQTQAFEEAEQAYVQALELDEADERLHNALASLYRAQKRFDEAKKHYERSIEIAPEFAQTRFNFANLLLDMGDTQGAKALYEKAIELDPGFTQAKFELEKLK
ncbi:MAG: tetratricopeptide repeat protein [Campylobacterales bacterium]|nr:tetratricopeptide repeat protein [Campylobacterales bacterium]